MMRIKTTRTFIFLLVSATVILALTVKDDNFKIHFKFSEKTKCMESRRASFVCIDKSLGQCVLDCAARSDCLALNFRRHFPLCEFFASTDGIFEKNSKRTGPCVHIKRDDMKVAGAMLECKCQAGKICDEDTNICVTPVCPKLTLENGTIIGNMNDIGSRIKYTCDANYTIENEAEDFATCQAYGTWTHIPKCIREMYLGCYVDLNPDRILNGPFLMYEPKMTTSLCLDYCQGHATKYALTQFSRECFCGNKVLKVEKRADNECNYQCAGNTLEFCGGANHFRDDNRNLVPFLTVRTGSSQAVECIGAP